MLLLYMILNSMISPKIDIVMDPGHGGTNLGAKIYGRKDLHEKDLTLKFAFLIEKAMKKKAINLRLTRRKDKYLTLMQRTQIAREIKPQCFISLHFNASALHNKQGIEIYFPPVLASESVESEYKHNKMRLNLVKNKFSSGKILADTYLHQYKRLGKANLSRNLARKLGWRLLAKKYKINNIQQGNYDVLLNSGVRAVLFEGGFIDNVKGAKKVMDSEYLKQLADDFTNSLQGICY
ncbi:MAG: N-acetylmuramoyl-L-alanine amidase [Deltaproteobacteria bacterium]|jgi:N-acetylmuramoyl-L-alanine amidase|nr:N-acetylmuramoyl-L-alanine amidase [Deltaproteobacteria bacterium]